MTTLEKITKAALARLDAGEPVHIILQDYADYEAELRPILERAIGKTVKPLTMQSSKAKNKNKQVMSPLLIVVSALALIVLLGVTSIFLLMGTENAPLIVTAQTACVGIPQAQITSLYAQQSQNQQNTNTRSDDSGLDGAVYEESEMLGEPPIAAVGGGSGVIVIDPVEMPADPSMSAIIATPSPMATMDMADESSARSVETDMEEMDMADSDVAMGAPAPVAVNSEPLNAGEIDDNAEWDTYQDYRRDYLDDYNTRFVRDVDVTGRQIIRVVDADNNPILNACVEIYNGESHISSSLTYATGMTMFLPNIDDSTRYVDSFRVVASYGDATVEGTIDREIIGGVTTLELPTTQNNSALQLDVMFLLDATGSMSDEIAQLQGNILTISEQIDALPYDVDVRYGLVHYRDRGDQYVTRVHPFTDSVAEFQEQLIAVRADGGGDYPESLNEGFDMALNAVNWRMDDTVRLVFLVADAPPHVDYQDDADYSLLMQDALARGIKVHPIASGGLEPEGEFVLRQIAQVTMGRFLFLTYDDGVVGTVGEDRPDLDVGTPEDEQGVGDYSVNQLDELVLRLITDELDALADQ